MASERPSRKNKTDKNLSLPQPISDRLSDSDMDDKVRAAIREELSRNLDPMKLQLADIHKSITSALDLATEARSLAMDSKNTAKEALSSANGAIKCATEAKAATDDLETRFQQLQEENDTLRENQVRLEAYSRRNNMRFECVAESPHENVDDKICNILNKMDVSPDVTMVACHRYGPKTSGHPRSAMHKPSGRPRPIMVKFLEYEVRNDVWSKRRSLGSLDEKIWIKEDYPPLIEKRRNILTPYLRAACQGIPKILGVKSPLT